MTEWDRILEERQEEVKAWQNTLRINSILRGQLTPTLEEVIQIMKRKYSKYGKEHRHE